MSFSEYVLLLGFAQGVLRQTKRNPILGRGDVIRFPESCGIVAGTRKPKAACNLGNRNVGTFQVSFAFFQTDGFKIFFRGRLHIFAEDIAKRPFLNVQAAAQIGHGKTA